MTPANQDHRDAIWIGPNAFAEVEGWTGKGPRPDFLSTATNGENWASVLKHAGVFKTYRNVLDKGLYRGAKKPIYTDDQLRDLIAFLKTHNLKTAIEVGGLRFRAGSDGKGMGKRYAIDLDIPALKRWERLGGTIDYITTDNMYGLYYKAKNKYKKSNRGAVLEQVGMNEIIPEAVDSLGEIQSAFPGAKLGIIECPSYFRFRFDNGKEADIVQRDFPQVYFREYMNAFLDECKEKKVTVHHFHFDYHIQGFIADANLLDGKELSLKQMPNAEDLSLERVRQIDAFFGNHGLATGICITPGAYGNKDFSGFPDRDAARAIQTVFSAFVNSGIEMDQLLFQHWHKYPTKNGPESEEGTFMYNVSKIMESGEFPRMLSGAE